MAEDFDEYMDEAYDDDEDDFDESDDEEQWDELDNDEFSPDDIAALKRSLQDANMGFTYLSVVIDGEHCFKCNKCGRTAPLHERPFPHKLNCPMRK